MKQRNTEPTTAIAYCRVSTEEQAAEGVSLDAQRERIEAYCKLRSLRLVEVVVDAGVSGGKPLAARAGGRRVLAAVSGRRVDVVVALKIDRVFRDCADCLDTTSAWDRRGVALHLLDLGGQAVDTASAMGRFFLTVMAGAAELERNQIRERTAAAMQHKAQHGEFCGGMAPYGFAATSDGKLVEVPAEQAVLRRVHEARARGLSLRGVVAELRAAGLVSRSGRPFGLTQVQRMARRVAA